MYLYLSVIPVSTVYLHIIYVNVSVIKLQSLRNHCCIYHSRKNDAFSKKDIPTVEETCLHGTEFTKTAY